MLTYFPLLATALICASSISSLAQSPISLAASLDEWRAARYYVADIVASGDGVLIGTNYGLTGGYLGPYEARIYRSGNDATWDQVDQSSPSELSAGAFGNGTFVLVGSAGQTMTSSTGEVWSSHVVGSDDFTAVTFADGKFRALVSATNRRQIWLDQARVWTSADGATWTQEGLTTHTSKRLAYGNGRYVVVGALNTFVGSEPTATYFLSSSADATTWSDTNVWSAYQTSVRDLVFGNGRFLAVLNDSRVMTSTDGVVWSAPQFLNPQASGSTVTAVTFMEGLFVACAQNGSLTLAGAMPTFRMFTSTDGLAWTAHRQGTGEYVRQIWPQRGGGVLLEQAMGILLPSVPRTLGEAPPAMPPSIDAQPQSQTVKITERATLTVQSLDAGVSYQWFRRLSDGTSQPIANATSFAYTPPLALPGNAYFWVRLSNAADHTDSDIARVTVTAPSVRGGDYLYQSWGGIVFEAIDVGAGTASYQWLRNDVPVLGATSSSLGFGVTRVTDGGMYRLVITTTAGSFTTNERPLVVVGLLRSPGTVPVGSTLVLTMAAQGPGLHYEWKVPAGTLADNDRISGSSTGTLTIRGVTLADSNQYSCEVRADGLTDRITRSVQVSVIVGPPAEVAFNALSTWQVGRMSAATVSAVGEPTSFTITGLPPGLSYVASTGNVFGRPTKAGTYTLRITARNSYGTSVPLVQQVVVAPINREFTGTFSGLVERDAETNGSLGGTLQVVAATNGTFTGSISLGAKIYRFAGSWLVDETGDATAHLRLTSRLALDLRIRANEEVLAGRLITPANQPGVSARAVLNPWTSMIKPSSYAGVYTAALLLPESLLGNSAVPQGTGYFGGSIGLNGAVVMSARLADNTVVTSSTILGADKTIPLHFPLYGGTGSAQGWQRCDATNLDGDLSWFKQAQPTKSTTRSYKGGFPLHTLSAIGGRLVVPAAGQLVLGATTGSNNASIAFDQGGLASPLTQAFTITSTNSAQLPTGAPVRLTLDKAQGKFTGSFIREGRTASLFGIFVPRLGKGTGHFQLPQSAASTSAILSGHVELSVQ